jgi:hypothetical protein
MRVCEVSSVSSGRDYILTWQWCIYSGSHNSIRCHGYLISTIFTVRRPHDALRLYLRGGVTTAERNHDRGLSPLARGRLSGCCPDSASEATGGVTRDGTFGGED